MKKIGVFLIFLAIIASSCARIREARAAHHQPFKPHHDKKMKQKRHR
jgi:hypothetical protein